MQHDLLETAGLDGGVLAKERFQLVLPQSITVTSRDGARASIVETIAAVSAAGKRTDPI